MLYLIYWIIAKAVDIYSLLILIYCIMTWFPIRTGILRDIFEGISKLVTPYLNLFRKIIPAVGGTLDFSPVIALIVLELAVRLIGMILF